VTPLDRLYAVLEGASYDGCATCGICCSNPWLHEEEAALLRPLAPLDIVEGVPFLAGEPCSCLSGTHCTQYGLRPLDCRLYPLDLVEEEGELWWVIFSDCRAPDALAAVLVPRIPALEALFTAEVLQRFQRQIAVTRRIWLPYAEKRYRKIQKFRQGTAALGVGAGEAAGSDQAPSGGGAGVGFGHRC
jgi:Fe-S-cluster containining protein